MFDPVPSCCAAAVQYFALQRVQVMPALSDAFGNAATMCYIGFETGVSSFVVPLRGSLGDSASPPQKLLWVHVRLSFGHMKELVLFNMHYATPPYSFVKLLNPRLRAQAVADIRKFWTLILELESSSDPLCIKWAKVLTVKSLTVVREVRGLACLNMEVPSGTGSGKGHWFESEQPREPILVGLS